MIRRWQPIVALPAGRLQAPPPTTVRERDIGSAVGGLTYRRVHRAQSVRGERMIRCEGSHRRYLRKTAVAQFYPTSAAATWLLKVVQIA